MKKLGVVLGAVCLLLMTAAPALALPNGENCRLHNGPDGTGGVSVTICVQTHEDLFAAQIEAYMDWSGSGRCANIVANDLKIQISRAPDPGGLELRDAPAYLVDPPNHILRQYSTGGFIDACGNSHSSTTWYNICPHTTDWDYRSTARYRLRWDDFPGDPVSAWYSLNSIRITVAGNYC